MERLQLKNTNYSVLPLQKGVQGISGQRLEGMHGVAGCSLHGHRQVVAMHGQPPAVGMSNNADSPSVSASVILQQAGGVYAPSMKAMDIAPLTYNCLRPQVYSGTDLALESDQKGSAKSFEHCLNSCTCDSQLGIPTESVFEVRSGFAHEHAHHAS